MQGLGILNSLAAAVSFDGTVVVGYMERKSVTGRFEAFTWTETQGVIGLGALPGHNSSTADDVSADGNVVVGTSRHLLYSEDGSELLEQGDSEVFLWTKSTGMIGTGILGGGGAILANDGKTLAGTRDQEAFRWTEETGMVGLGWLPGTNSSSASDMAQDGRVVVGSSSGHGPAGFERRGFIGSDLFGLEDMQQALIARHGIGSTLTNWKLSAPQAISSNGQFITGWGYNPAGTQEAWLIRLDGPWVTTAVPEPTAVILALAALLPLTLGRCRA